MQQDAGYTQTAGASRSRPPWWIKAIAICVLAGPFAFMTLIIWWLS